MSFLIAAPQIIANAATDLANIGSTIGSANNAAAAATTGVLPAAADEVSEQIAGLFSRYAAGFRQLSAQAEEFHGQFVQALTAGANTYAGADADVVRTLSAPVAASAQALSAGNGEALTASLGGGLPRLGASLSGGLSGLVLNGIHAPVNILEQFGQAQIGFNATLVNGEFGLNASLVSTEVGLEQAVFGTNNALNGTVNNVFNFWNLVLGTGEQTVNSLLGAQVPACLNLTSSLLVGCPTLVAGGGQIGGLLGALDQKLLFDLNVVGLVTGGLTGNAPVGLLQQFAQGQIGLTNNLVNGELAFNQFLVAGEMGLEHTVFGSNYALNGVVNDVYNFWNLTLGTGEQTADSLLGAQIPACFTASLLAGNPCQVIGGGEVGGLLGALDEKLLFDLNVVGLPGLTP